MLVFFDVDFNRILGGFGGPKSLIFAFFFDVFVDAIFQARLERRKFRPRWANKTQKAKILGWAPVIPRPLGKGKDRGKNTSDRIARKNVEIGQLRFDRASWKSVRHAVGTPSVAGGLKAPRGGHRRPPTPWHLAHRRWRWRHPNSNPKAKNFFPKNGYLSRFFFSAQMLVSRSKISKEIAPEPPKIEPRGLQNQARSPPRRHF